MTYKEFYGSDYDTFKNVLDKVLNTIHSNALACIQYTTSRIKSPESVMKKIGNEYSLLHDIIGARIICSFVDEIYEVKDWIHSCFKVVEVRDLIRSELKRCADEIASLDLSFQTIKDRIEG